MQRLGGLLPIFSRSPRQKSRTGRTGRTSRTSRGPAGAAKCERNPNEWVEWGAKRFRALDGSPPKFRVRRNAAVFVRRTQPRRGGGGGARRLGASPKSAANPPSASRANARCVRRFVVKKQATVGKRPRNARPTAFGTEGRAVAHGGDAYRRFSPSNTRKAGSPRTSENAGNLRSSAMSSA